MANGSEKHALTNRCGPNTTPAWSPDGGRIVFASGRTGNWDLFSNCARMTARISSA